jgi:hypothetical protein
LRGHIPLDTPLKSKDKNEIPDRARNDKEKGKGLSFFVTLLFSLARITPSFISGSLFI